MDEIILYFYLEQLTKNYVESDELVRTLIDWFITFVYV